MLASAYRSRNVPQALMNLVVNNGIAKHRYVENDDDHAQVLSRGGEDIRSSRMRLTPFGQALISQNRQKGYGSFPIHLDRIHTVRRLLETICRLPF